VTDHPTNRVRIEFSDASWVGQGVDNYLSARSGGALRRREGAASVHYDRSRTQNERRVVVEIEGSDAAVGAISDALMRSDALRPLPPAPPTRPVPGYYVGEASSRQNGFGMRMTREVWHPDRRAIERGEQ